MGIWQIIWIVLICLSLGISISEHGKPKTGNNSFWTSLVATIVNVFILYMGGFFG